MSILKETLKVLSYFVFGAVMFLAGYLASSHIAKGGEEPQKPCTAMDH